MSKKPHSISAEKAVLGSMLLSKEALFNSIARLSEEDFYIEDNKVIFNAMSKVHNKGKEVDTITVEDQLVSDGSKKLLNNKDYLYNLVDETITPSNIDHHIRILQDKSVLRRLVDQAEEIANGWSSANIDDIGDYVSNAESKLLEITRSRNVGDFKRAGEILDVFKQKLITSEKKGSMTGVVSGFSDLDRRTQGFQKGDLIILAARPSMGKTALALNFAMNAANKNETVALFSLEMSSEQLIQRMLSSQSFVNSSKIRNFNLNENDESKIDSAIIKLSKYEMYIDDTPAAKLGDIQTKARKLKSKRDNIGLIIIDYLQLIRMVKRKGHSENRQQEVSEISRGLKEIARELNVPVIALSQLSREVEKRPNKRPMLSDLRESGSIEQDADIVMFIYRDDYYNKSEEDDKNAPSIVEVDIAKHRNGPTGDLKLVFNKNIGYFSSYFNKEEKN